MWIPPRGHPVSGINGCDRGSPDGGATDDLGRLVRLVQSNERLSGVLRVASDRLHGVRAYLAAADSNVGLGNAYYRHLRAKHSWVLTLLRANRMEARRLMARLDPDLRAQGFFSVCRRPPR